jgi:hypothetical protein
MLALVNFNCFKISIHLGATGVNSSDRRSKGLIFSATTQSEDQGCQIVLGTTYQNAKNIPNKHKIYKMAVCKVDQMAINFTNIFHCKTLQNLPKRGFWV